MDVKDMVQNKFGKHGPDFSANISQIIFEYLDIHDEEIFIVHGNSQYCANSFCKIQPVHKVSSKSIGAYVESFSRFMLIRTKTAVCSLFFNKRRNSLSVLLCNAAYLKK